MLAKAEKHGNMRRNTPAILFLRIILSISSIACGITFGYPVSMKKFCIPAFILAALALAGCSVTETMNLTSSPSGVQSYISVEQYFVDVLSEMSAFLPQSDETIIDSAISNFAYQLENTDDASNTIFIKTGDNEYTGFFSFNSFQTLAEELGGSEQSIIAQTSNSLTFYCDIDNYHELENIVPFLADSNVAVYLADYNVGYSEDDYKEMLVFLIGEEAPASLDRSAITLDVTLPGAITSLSGDGVTQTGENTFTYTFRLIDFLLLSSPLSFSVEWV